MPPSYIGETIARKLLVFKDSCFPFIFCHVRDTLHKKMREERIYTISELNRKARQILEGEIGSVWLKGEVSNLTRAMSGHLYFTLKDEGSQISAVRFKGRSAFLHSPTIEDGMEILAYGRLTIYEPRGRYQFVVSIIQPAGVGALQLAFERLKEKLGREGLFDKAHKKPVPAFPQRIGVVTSPTGAAIRDIGSVLKRRWPLAEVYLFASSVQGETAAEEIVTAIAQAEAFNQRETPLDLLIVGRGGGSLEDLASFNEERVARAIFDCEIPIVSAVGHEIDFTIADFVADLRAPTPSAAAELVTPDHFEVLTSLVAFLAKSQRNMRALLERRVQGLQTHLKGYIFRIPGRRVEMLAQGLDLRLAELLRLTGEAWKKRQRDATRLEDLLRLADPSLPLRRGYSLTFIPGEPTPLRNATSLSPGERIETRLLNGRILSQVEEVIES